jgi:hypothetical protein
MHQEHDSAKAVAGAQDNVHAAEHKVHKTSHALKVATEELSEAERKHGRNSLGAFHAETKMWAALRRSTQAIAGKREALEELRFSEHHDRRSIADVVHSSAVAMNVEKRHLHHLRELVRSEGETPELHRKIGESFQRLTRYEKDYAEGIHLATQKNKTWGHSMKEMTPIQHRFGEQGRALKRTISDQKHVIQELREGVAKGGGPYAQMHLEHAEAKLRRLERTTKYVNQSIVASMSLGEKKTLAAVIAMARGAALGSLTMDQAVSAGLGTLGHNVNSALKGLGVSKKVSFTLTNVAKDAAGLAGVMLKQEGGFTVPGSGSGDKYPAVVPYGGFVMNREATAAYGLQRGGNVPVMLEPGERYFPPNEVARYGAHNLAAMNQAVPRFQNGGRLGPEPILVGPSGALRTAGQAAIHQVYEGARHYLASQQPSFDGLAGLNVPTGPIERMAREMVSRIWGPSQWAPFAALEMQEAGWNPQAVNAKSGAAGLAQALPPSKYPPGAWPYAGPESAKLQLQWMMSYIRARYGDPATAWAHEQSAGWYQRGGFVNLLPGVNMSRGKEPEILGDLEALSSNLGKSIYVISGYRTPQHSAEVGGFPNDPHTRGEAADIGVGSASRSSASVLTEGILHGVNLDRPFYPESASEINHVQLWHAQGGPSSKKASTQHSYKEDVPAVYGGAKTGSLHFGAVPKSLHGIEAEIKRRSTELTHYRMVHKHALKVNRPAVAQAIAHNITAIQGRLRELFRARTKARSEVAKHHFSRSLGRALGHLTGYEKHIEAHQRSYNTLSERAEQVVGLEPQPPELPANATEAQQKAAEAAYIANLEGYVATREEPAYLNVLAAEQSWRSSILGGEGMASALEGVWETQVRQRAHRIEGIHHAVENWKKHHKGKALPPGLKRSLAEIPMLRFEERELRKKVGEGRGYFYPGRKHPVRPPIPPLPGTGTFEENLTEVQGYHWPGLHGPVAVIPPYRVPGSFGGAIWDTQEAIEGLGLKIAQAKNAAAGAGVGPSETGTTGPTEREQLLEQLLLQAHQREAVKAAGQRTLAGMPYAGAYESGGIVAALVGETGPEIAAFPTGTRIHNARESQGILGAGDIAVHIHGDIVSDHPDPVAVFLRDPRTQQMIRQEARSVKINSGAPSHVRFSR